MTKNAVARRYAKALFRLLDASSIEAAQRGLRDLAGVSTESSALKHVLASPVFDLDEKSAVVSELSERLGCPPIMKDFLNQLLKNNRLIFLPEIAEAFAELADQRQGKQHVWVNSAKALDADEQQDIQTELSALTKRNVEVTFQSEPQLIAGLQIRIGSKVYDSTVRGRLTKMKALLAKG